MIKVSVIVPTYKSGDGLDRLVASLDAQTLSPDEFEIVFVDDGSPDDTFDRLLSIQSTRSNVRVERIENSGWPCRPRNVGTDLSRGEYVLYMDHDDVLYPDALRAGWEFANANGADALNGKEARTHDSAWAIRTYSADVGNSKGREDAHPLVPMNPHKLYRRQFLNEHGIRFREDGRVFWEDIFFNLKVTRYAHVISTLSSVPFYHWYQTPGSGSKSFVRTSPEFWQRLREIFEAIDEDLSGPEFERERRQMLLHQYQGRVLGSFDGASLKRDPDVQTQIFQRCRELQAEYVPIELDELLNCSKRARAELLRAGDERLLRELIADDLGLPARFAITDARWRSGALHAEGTAVWIGQSGRRHALERRGGRIVKRLPAEVEAKLSTAALDVTDEVLGATVQLGIRNRRSRETWMLPSESKVTVADGDSEPKFEVTANGTIDPENAAFGGKLEKGAWDVNARCTLAGGPQQARVRSEITPRAWTDGKTSRLAYTTVDGFLAVDIDQGVRRLGHALPLVTDSARIRREGDTVHVAVPAGDIEVEGDGHIRTTVRILESSGYQPGRIARMLGRRGRERVVRALPAQLVCVASERSATLTFDLPKGSRSAAVMVAADDEPSWHIVC